MQCSKLIEREKYSKPETLENVPAGQILQLSTPPNKNNHQSNNYTSEQTIRKYQVVGLRLHLLLYTDGLAREASGLFW